jgi:hypothetical protein
LKQSNFFLNTRSLTSSKEDHLTEFLAALISMDEKFNSDFSDLLLGEYAAAKGWETPIISSVETQVNFLGTNCCPDMRFTLEDGHTIVCENKIEAPQTQGSAKDPRGQLVRYLDLPCDGLAYIRATPSPKLEESIVGHSKFITRNGHHFLWRDIYPLLEENDNPLVVAVRKGFEVMGFVPPLPAIGTLSNFDSDSDEKNRAAFKELWRLAVDYGRQCGWRVETNKNAEMYYYSGQSDLLYQVFVSPSKSERFLLRLTLKDGVDVKKLHDQLQQVDIDVPFETVAFIKRGKRDGKNISEDAIDITTSLRHVIGDTEDRKQMQQLLLNFVKSFLVLVP